MYPSAGMNAAAAAAVAAARHPVSLLYIYSNLFVFFHGLFKTEA